MKTCTQTSLGKLFNLCVQCQQPTWALTPCIINQASEQSDKIIPLKISPAQASTWVTVPGSVLSSLPSSSLPSRYRIVILSLNLYRAGRTFILACMQLKSERSQKCWWGTLIEGAQSLSAPISLWCLFISQWNTYQRPTVLPNISFFHFVLQLTGTETTTHHHSVIKLVLTASSKGSAGETPTYSSTKRCFDFWLSFCTQQF